MTALDLPACFETDWRMASRLGPWGMLEALARALAGEIPTPGRVPVRIAAVARP